MSTKYCSRSPAWSQEHYPAGTASPEIVGRASVIPSPQGNFCIKVKPSQALVGSLQMVAELGEHPASITLTKPGPTKESQSLALMQGINPPTFINSARANLTFVSVPVNVWGWICRGAEHPQLWLPSWELQVKNKSQGEVSVHAWLEKGMEARTPGLHCQFCH